ncbi:MAG: Holliday junction resolvase RuvX [bacterium]|nr:Holliday junction resolvase RuvX [bacterium]
MITLGIDYGRKKIGFALSEGQWANPLGIAKVTSTLDTVEKVRQAMVKHSARRVVVGISEGKMKDEQKEFAKLLSRKLKVEVRTWDETLTTEDAKSLSLAANIPRAKRQKLEDAFAACLMLQSYLDHGQEKSP